MVLRNKQPYVFAAIAIPSILILVTRFLPVGDWLGQTPLGLIVASLLCGVPVAFFGWFMPAPVPRWVLEPWSGYWDLKNLSDGSNRTASNE